ncbi:response regulator transcription factor [Moorella sp. Hama-1]|uniref:response regulator transcription factor n=1 Tax=Moorella sp. Hama-1 TaxID=2138101 RepID=UPI000D657072|nr:response regulator transcription factor [Moorella sp. Hama-1]BCV21732.1 DNA-binding response regulator [Moorella sp. Hama-1]
MRILIVEDETTLANTLARCLREEGYAADIAYDGEEGVAFAETVIYDLIILDLMLPRLDGMEVIRRLRNERIQAPVLMLTARDTVADKVRGLDAGADDYLTKPFALAELLARVRALLRRESENKSTVLQVGDLTMDTVSRQVRRGEKEINLTNKEYALLEYLMRNPNRVLNRTQIAEHVWDYDFSGMSNIVDVYIRYLRRKIDDNFEPKLLYTIRGSGYSLREPSAD